MKYLIFFLASFFSNLIYCQKPDITNVTEPITKNKYKAETTISFKFGTTINTVNKTIYKGLNNGLSSGIYKPDETDYFINPYINLGIERKMFKHFGMHFNIGFFQTLQQYNTIDIYNMYSPVTTITIKTESQYLNNNVFLEILPVYIIKNTRVFGGFNITRTSPTIKAKQTLTASNTGESEVINLEDKPEESYHIYSQLGVMQGIPIKKNEFTITLSYFGILQKYDSGINLAIGFMF